MSALSGVEAVIFYLKTYGLADKKDEIVIESFGVVTRKEVVVWIPNTALSDGDVYDQVRPRSSSSNNFNTVTLLSSLFVAIFSVDCSRLVTSILVITFLIQPWKYSNYT